MTTQYTTILKLALPVQGELSGTWGDVVNDNITQMVEQAIAGKATINSWTANAHTLTTADGTTSESRCAILELTDTGTALTGAGTVTCPTNTKLYIVDNNTAEIITIKTAAGTGVAVPVGKTMLVYCDGTNVVEGVTHANSLSLGTSTVTVNAIDTATDLGAGSSSNSNLPTQLAVKTYVDSQVGTVDTLAEILANGNTTGANDIEVDTTQKVQFRDAAIYVNSSADGQLDIVADGEVQIDTALVDINGNLDVSGTALVAGVLTTTAATVFNGGFASNADSTLGTDKKVQFRDTAIYVNSSVDGQLDIVADGEVQIDTALVDINGNLDVSGTTNIGGSVSFTKNAIAGVAISTTSRASNTVTVTTSAVHGLTSGDLVNINGVADTSFNGYFTVAVSSTTVFTYSQTGADGSSTGGTSTEVVYNLNASGTALNWMNGPLNIAANSGIDGLEITQSGAGNGLHVTGTTGLVGNVDVTGTVTADDAGFYQASGTSQLRVGSSSSYNWNISRDNVSTGGLQIQSKDAGADVTRAFFALSGDISFYEDTGTTPKFFWDADDEALRVGSTSAIFTNSVISGVSALGPTIGGKQTTAAQSAGGFWNSDTGTVNLLNFYAGSAGTQVGSIKGSSTGVSLLGTGGEGLTVYGNEGNVGIGSGGNTISNQLVGYKIGANANYFQVANGSTGLAATNGLRIGVSSAGLGEIYLQSASPSITLDTSGNVGIGESAPATFLDLAFTSTDQTDGIQIHNKQFGGYGGAIEWVSRTAASLGGGSDRLAGQIQVAGANNWATDDNVESVMKFSLVEDNTFRNILELNPTAEAVINQDSIDMDFRVESSGNANMLHVDGGNNGVGIGTTGTTTPLTVNGGTASVATIQLGNHGDNASIHAKYNLQFKADSTESIADRAIGFAIGAGTSLGLTASASIFNDFGADQDFRVESVNNATMFVVDASADNVQITKAQSGASAMEVSNNSSNGSDVQAIATSLLATSNNTNCFHLKSTTQTIASYGLRGDGSSTFTSDARLKTDIVNVEDGYLEKFNAVRLVNFKWKADPDSPAQMGVIAQEMEEIFPDLVIEDEDAIGTGETYKSVSYSKLNTIALKVIQELSAKVETLEARIAALES